MSTRVVILGAGFGGLELATSLSEALGDEVDVALIDKSDSFVFGFSKLEVMFGHKPAEAVRLPYSDFVKPGVRLLRETVVAIDPEARSVTTDAAVHEADFLVVALGADYDIDATPGLAEDGNEFYSVPGAERVAGRAAGVLGRPGRNRRLRSPLQVPARAERSGAAAARLPGGARHPRRLSNHLSDATAEPGAAVSRDLGGAARRFRRARHRFPGRRPDRLTRPGPQGRCAQRRRRGALRPLPRRSQAPRAGCGDRERDDGRRLRAGGVGDAEDEIPRGLCGG